MRSPQENWPTRPNRLSQWPNTRFRLGRRSGARKSARGPSSLTVAPRKTVIATTRFTQNKRQMKAEPLAHSARNGAPEQTYRDHIVNVCRYAGKFARDATAYSPQ